MKCKFVVILQNVLAEFDRCALDTTLSKVTNPAI